MSVDNEARHTFTDGVETALPPPPSVPTGRPRWRAAPSTRLVLGCLILVAGGFTGGVLEAKHTGTTSTTAARTATTTATRTGAVGGFAGGAGAGQTGTSTFGTVKLVDGSTIYVTTTDGSVVKVTTSGATKLSVSATGKASELKTGATIAVTGTADASGTIKATAVTQSGTTATSAPATAGAAATGGQGTPAAGSAAQPSGPPAG